MKKNTPYPIERLPEDVREVIFKYRACSSINEAKDLYNYLISKKIKGKSAKRIMATILPESILRYVFPEQSPSALYDKYEYGMSDW